MFNKLQILNTVPRQWGQISEH